MAEKTLALWKRVLAYAGFSVFALVTAFFLTFPYEALAGRAKREADAQGYYLRIGSMGPGFFSVRASDVQLSKKQPENSDKPVEALQIDKVSVGPSLFPPGLKVNARLMGGSVSVAVGGLGAVKVAVDVDDLDVSKGNVKGLTGVDMSGSISAHVDLSIPKASAGTGQTEPDLGQATGLVTLTTRGLSINGGTMEMTIPQFGPEPAPIDLPKIVFGDINGKVSFDKGAGTIDEFAGKSPDLELGLSGTLKLAKRLEYSEPNVEVRLKADPEFQRRLGLVGSALSMMGSDPKDPAWRMGRLTGYIGRPNFR